MSRSVALRRRERERHAIAGDLDLLRLRDDRVVEHRLRLPDLGEQRVLEACRPSAARGLRTAAPRLGDCGGSRDARGFAGGARRLRRARRRRARGSAAPAPTRRGGACGAGCDAGARPARGARRRRRRSDPRSAPACAGGSTAAAPSRGDSAAARRRGCRLSARVSRSNARSRSSREKRVGQRLQPIALAFAGDLGIVDARRIDRQHQQIAHDARQLAADERAGRSPSRRRAPASANAAGASSSATACSGVEQQIAADQPEHRRHVVGGDRRCR